MNAIEESAVFLRGCVVCGTDATHEHHIVKRKLGGIDTISLCPKHHVWADRGKIAEKVLWRLRGEKAAGLELVNDYELCWEFEYHKDVMMYDDVRFHDFYCEEYSHCLFPPSLDPESHHVYRQCMISLWLNDKRQIDLSNRSSRVSNDQMARDEGQSVSLERNSKISLRDQHEHGNH